MTTAPVFLATLFSIASSPIEDLVVVDVAVSCSTSSAIAGAYEGRVVRAQNEYSAPFVGGTWTLLPAERGWPKTEEELRTFLWDRFLDYDPESFLWQGDIRYRLAIYDATGDMITAEATLTPTIPDGDRDGQPEESDFDEISFQVTLDPPSGNGSYSMIGDYPAETGGQVLFTISDPRPWLSTDEDPDFFPESEGTIQILWRQPPTASMETSWGKLKSLFGD